jgi:hypothetical protein
MVFNGDIKCNYICFTVGNSTGVSVVMKGVTIIKGTY